MGHWFYHWVYQDLWMPIWPNIAADIIMSAWILKRVRTHLHRHHKAISDEINRGQS